MTTPTIPKNNVLYNMFNYKNYSFEKHILFFIEKLTFKFEKNNINNKKFFKDLYYFKTFIQIHFNDIPTIAYLIGKDFDIYFNHDQLIQECIYLSYDYSPSILSFNNKKQLTSFSLNLFKKKLYFYHAFNLLNNN